jgi:hypothetical protein
VYNFDDTVETEVGTCRCPDCHEGACAVTYDDEDGYFSNCCGAEVDEDFISFDKD